MNRNKNTKSNANVVGVDAHIDPHSRGITLVALIITIIVMLILVGVSITIAINGGLFDTTKRAAKETEKAKNKEQELASGRIEIGDIWYDSLEDYVKGKASEYQPADTEPTDLNRSNTEFIYNPAGWTTGNVKIKIEVKEKVNGMLQYSRDGITWERYKEETEIEAENNGEVVYVRVINDKEEVGTVATGNVSNIDKEVPIENQELYEVTAMTTDTSFRVRTRMQEELSGFLKAELYYKKDSDTEYSVMGPANFDDTDVGTTGLYNFNFYSDQFSPSTTYNCYALIYDVAGNMTRSPAEGTVDVTTKAPSLIGRTATIEGKKFIVMYDAGEKITIGDTTYEIPYTQLISEDVFWPDAVPLGYNDNRFDWTNSTIIKNADYNKDLGILTTPSNNTYWLADRRVRESQGQTPPTHRCEILTITGSGSTSWVKITYFGYYPEAYSPLSGIRPIVTLTPEILAKYLDAE